MAAEEISKVSDDQPGRQAEWMLEAILGLSHMQLYSDKNLTLNPEEVLQLKSYLKRRADHEPLQYILGTTEFRNLTLKVDRRALIPRPETEGLVDIGLEFIRSVPSPRILDVGTGCGALVLAFLDEHPDSRCYGVDISRDALDLASENGRALGFDDRVTWLESDVLAEDFADQFDVKFDLIISNPPYVAQKESGSLPPEVRDWEPATALFSKGSDLDTIQRLAEITKDLLLVDCHLICEIGETQGERASQLFKRSGWDAHVRDDLNGKPRYLVARPS